MNFNISAFQKQVAVFFNKILDTDESIASIKYSPDSWTLKEMIGHLIDSASNNHQRFVRLQLEQKLVFPAYDAEAWIKIEKLNNFEWAALIDLWKKYNDFILHVIINIDGKCLKNYWEKDGEKFSLEFLVNDYYRHLKWHEELYEKRVEVLLKKSF